ncbi:hypothetical protein BB560_005627 [Smittium megazygosporum]|uniref:Actin-related protein 2/3 complex subunit 5 n=1 Tax=Smittium megazygosporum TaxID=133381 RepID=A0A2T9Z223_9FUNG|nr:hypothetical protein BB560_005627 [Smittium megazygosporum]
MSFRSLEVTEISPEQLELIRQMEALGHTAVEENLDSVYSERATSVRNYTDALRKSLESPYFGLEDSSLQEKFATLVHDVLSSTRIQDAKKAMDPLSQEDLCLLMKYVYYCLSRPRIYNCSALLSWHEKIVETAGVGCISRVLADKRAL